MLSIVLTPYIDFSFLIISNIGKKKRKKNYFLSSLIIIK